MGTAAGAVVAARVLERAGDFLEPEDSKPEPAQHSPEVIARELEAFGFVVKVEQAVMG